MLQLITMLDELESLQSFVNTRYTQDLPSYTPRLQPLDGAAFKLKVLSLHSCPTLTSSSCMDSSTLALLPPCRKKRRPLPAASPPSFSPTTALFVLP